MILLYEGTEDQFWDKLREVIREEIQANDSKKVSPLSKKEAYTRLGINSRTLDKVLIEMNLTTIYPTDINRILLKYPKYIKKAMME